MKPKVNNFAELVRWVADTHHDGVVDAIAPRCHISGALADKWVKGNVRRPSFDSLEKFCSAYKLDMGWVWNLIKRTAAVLLVGWLMSSGSVGAEEPTPSLVKFTDNHSYRVLRHLRKRYQQLCKVFHPLRRHEFTYSGFPLSLGFCIN